MKTLENTYTAFNGHDLIIKGDLKTVILAIKKEIGRSEHTSALIFNDHSGKTMDFNFQGTSKDVLKRLELFTSSPQEEISASGPGRPKLGVVSREISLLPKHWEWLAIQPGGASGTLRRLVENEIKKDSGQLTLKQLQERCYQAMSVLAGDLQEYESALRAIYKKDKSTFLNHIKAWPKDIKKYIGELAEPIFST